jgi:hypothetical protein
MPSAVSEGLEDNSEERDELTDVFHSVLEPHGVTRPEVEEYASRNIAPGFDLRELPSRPTSQILVTQSAADLPRFSGEVEDYAEFKMEFLAQVVDYSEGPRLRLLKSCLDEESRQMISICQGGQTQAFFKAIKILDDCYDQPALVIDTLMQRVNEHVNTDCSRRDDEKAFEKVVRGVRICFDRILMLQPLGVLAFKTLISTWIRNMPPGLRDQTSKLAHFKREECNFRRVLEDAEKFVGWKRFESRQKLVRPSGDRPPRKNIHGLQLGSGQGTNTQDETTGYNGEEEVPVDTPWADPPVNQALLAAATINNRGGPPQPSQAPPRRVKHKCYLCKTGVNSDHFTINCEKILSDEELTRIVRAEKICLVCGESGHYPAVCVTARVGGEGVLCRKAECSQLMHTKSGRFCALCKRTS